MNSEKPVYEKGQLILYGRTGVCLVEDITSVKDKLSGVVQQYYVLQPLYQKCNITIPVDNDKVFSRPIISREEAERVISLIPDVVPEVYYNRNINQLREYYRRSMENFDCASLIKMTMSLYKKKQEAEAQKRKFGAVDERYMKEAEDLLFGELSAALEIPREEVQEYIIQFLSKNRHLGGSMDDTPSPGSTPGSTGDPATINSSDNMIPTPDQISAVRVGVSLNSPAPARVGVSA